MPLDAVTAARLIPVSTTTPRGRTVSALMAKPATLPAPADGARAFYRVRVKATP